MGISQVHDIPMAQVCDGHMLGMGWVQILYMEIIGQVQARYMIVMDWYWLGIGLVYDGYKDRYMIRISQVEAWYMIPIGQVQARYRTGIGSV